MLIPTIMETTKRGAQGWVMFEKYNPSELRIYLKPILEALEADRSDDWAFLWGELQKFDRYLEIKEREER